ncbi:MAG: RelA/SpoT family protein [Bacteroidales bacterium]|nr:RelA/SpoT family protein [Bacteroidales bacterium]MCF8338301.1 RelA/SpoT family protein [Bacteroidales bacterium]
MYKVEDADQERKEILKRYRGLINAWQSESFTPEARKNVRKAFNLAIEAHKDMRRKSGEPYIYHPIEVATLCVNELGLGEVSIICALLHDVVEDTDYTIEDIENIFGPKVAEIIDGLTKIEEFLDQSPDKSKQAENFRKILISMSKDIRVILIKLADRLHNMRTLDSLPSDRKLKIASETMYFYAPFAHRLGLFQVKSELEDLALKFTQPEVYHDILKKIERTRENREAFISEFIYPIKKSLNEEMSIQYRIEARLKSISSIWEKMRSKKISFEEVFDLFAIRIIIDVPRDQEKIDCWKVYSMVTKHYIPRHDRLRDWISTPKANGYESLHTTVMSDKGRWVEVQIRTERMNEIAEHGYAAHWKYKSLEEGENSIDRWINRINQLLKESESGDNPLEFFDDFKLNLFTDEIFVFTPKGELRTLPKHSTVLDFAYSIHSEVGNHALGAKLNHKVVALSQELNSGDQVEIITSSNVYPQEEWLYNAITARARNHIKKSIREYRKKYYEEGRQKLQKCFEDLGLEFTDENINTFRQTNNLKSTTDLFYMVAVDKIGLKELKDCCNGHQSRQIKLRRYIPRPFRRKQNGSASLKEEINHKLKENPKELILGDVDEVRWNAAKCCNPIPGDDVVGYIKSDNVIEIHRVNCPTAIQLMSKLGNRIIKAKWREKGMMAVLAGLRIEGLDRKGLVNEITEVISQKYNINIRSMNIQASDSKIAGDLMLYVNGNEDLHEVIRHLRKIKNIQKVYRINRNS